MSKTTHRLKRELSQLSSRLRKATSYGEDEPAGEYLNDLYSNIEQEIIALVSYVSTLIEDVPPKERSIAVRNIQVHARLLAELARVALNDDYHLYLDDVD